MIRRLPTLFVALLALVAGALTLDARPAQACSISGPSLTCQGGWLAPGTEAIPSNLTQFTWYASETYTWSEADRYERSVELEREGGGAAPEVTLTTSNDGWLTSISLDAPLEPGTWTLRAETVCLLQHVDSEPETHLIEWTFEVLPDALVLPEVIGTLGHLPIREEELLLTDDGECQIRIDALVADLDPEFESPIADWIDVLHWRTWVRPDGWDEFAQWRPSTIVGERFPEGESWVGRGTDRIIASCDLYTGNQQVRVAPGDVEVYLEAYLPGTDEVGWSTTTTIRFACDGEESSTGESTGTAPGEFSGTERSEEPTASDTGSSSGGCSSVPASGAPWGALLLAGLLFGLRRRVSLDLFRH